MSQGMHALNYFASLCVRDAGQNHWKIIPFTATHTYIAHTLHPHPLPGVDRITVHMDHLHRNIRTQLDKSIYDTNNTHDGCWHQHSCVESCKNKIGMWNTYRPKSSAIKCKVKWTCMLFHLTANGLTKPSKINSNLFSKVTPEKQWIQRKMNILSTSLIEYGNSLSLPKSLSSK